MKKKRINPFIKIFFASALFVGIVLIVILIMGYRYMTFAEGKFIGKIKNNVPYQGMIKYTDGQAADLSEGYRLVFKNGDIYEGELKNIVRDGKGKMTFVSSGAVYEGTFLNNEMTGKGVLTYPNGDVYEGDFVNGKKEGNGVEKIKDKLIYTGEFSDDMYNGYGLLEFLAGSEPEPDPEPVSSTTEAEETQPTKKYNFGDDDTSDPTEEPDETEPEQDKFAPYHAGGYEVVGKYEGYFKNGAQHGKGKQFYSGGDTYEGDYLFGRRTGKGKYVWSTGEVYEGGFYNDLLDTRVTDENGLLVKDANGKTTHGEKAVYTRSDGSVFTGYFEAGKQVTVDE